MADVLTTDATGSHGSRPDVVLLNEVSHIGSEDFAATLADNLTKMPTGFALFASNAGILGSWAWNWRELYREDPRWHFMKTTEPPPWQRVEDLEEARRRNPPQRYKRLYQGQWVSASGDALDEADLLAATTLDGPIWARESWEACCMGMDLAIRRDHASVITLLIDLRRDSRRVRVARVDSWKPLGGSVDLESVFRTVLRNAQTYGCRQLCYDQWQAEHMAQRLRQHDMECDAISFSGQSAMGMATAMLECFRSRIIDIPNDVDLLRDLRKLSIEERGGGFRLTATRDEHGHADRAMALAVALPLAVQVLGEGPVFVDRPEPSRYSGDPYGMRRCWTRRGRWIAALLSKLNLYPFHRSLRKMSTMMLERPTSQRGRVDRQAGILRNVKLIGNDSKRGRHYPQNVLKESINRYESCPVYANHADLAPAVALRIGLEPSET